MPNDTTPATIGADARSSFIRWYAGFLLSDEMHAAHVWDNDHIPAQAWRAALASAAQPASAPAAVAEPVAWLHDDPQRYDVIHAEVKDLLVKSRDAAGHLHRPLDKSAHYTIPLYTAPAPAAQGDALTYEQQWAIRQGHEIAASDSYFDARPQIDNNDRRKVFEAGFERGWDAARSQAKEGGAHA